MLPRVNRLPSPLIRKIVSNGRRIHKGQVTLYIKNRENGIPRFAIIVPLSVDKRATVRIRIKRQIRETIRALLPHIDQHYDIVLRTNGSVNKDDTITRTLIHETLVAAGVLKNSS